MIVAQYLLTLLMLLELYLVYSVYLQYLCSCINIMSAT